VAVRGTVADGHNFITTAIEKGAVAVICEELPLMLLENITYIKVSNSSEAVALHSTQLFTMSLLQN
jgi:UDP-N-acetylmuramoyl-L-alanyl-D-glutamate--2,6-diaminopimelate ligase